MEVINQFGIQPTLLFAQIINFLIILFLLKKFLFGPITKALEARRTKIEESLKNADLIEEKLKNTEEKSAQILENTQRNAHEIVSEAKKAAEAITAEGITQAKAQAEDLVAASRLQIENERTQMQKQLEKDTLNLVLGVVKKVLGRTLKEAEKKEITKNAVRELSTKVQ